MPFGLDYHTFLRYPNYSWKLPDEGILPTQQEEIPL